MFSMQVIHIQQSYGKFILYGRGKDGVAKVVRVEGFVAYLYAKLPRDFTPQQLDRVNYHLQTDFYNSVQLATIVEKKTMFGYTETKSNYLEVGVTNQQIMRQLEASIAKLITSELEMEFFNSALDSMLVFINDISLFSWVRVNECTNELVVNIKSIEAEPPSENHVIDHHILSFDIECISRPGIFPSADTDAIIQIATALQIGTTIVETRVFMLRDSEPITGVIIHEYNDEASLLQAFSNYICDCNPDILTGFNIINFDIPYIIDRMCNLKIQKARAFGRSKNYVRYVAKLCGSKQMGTRQTNMIDIDGRLVMDVYNYISTNYKLPSYTLNSVAKHFLNDQKEDVHHSQITPMFNGNRFSRHNLATYCIKDAILPLTLMNKLQILINNVSMSRVCRVPISYLLDRGQQARVTSMIIGAIKNTDYLFPNYVPRSSDSTFDGATVLNPKRGYYTCPIATLDFASLYPSIMIAYNLCFTTVVRDNTDIGEVNTSPLGHRFVKPEIVRGILPTILERLLVDRKEVKKRMSAETNLHMKDVLNGLQNAIKLAANSLYGYTGALQYGVMPCVEISSSVTAYGRKMIETTRDWVLTTYPGSDVIYGGEFHFDSAAVEIMSRVFTDTDSVMVKFQVSSVEEALALGREAASRTHSLFPHPIRLEFEKVYYPYLLVNRKKYAGLFWTRAEKHDKVNKPVHLKVPD